MNSLQKAIRAGAQEHDDRANGARHRKENAILKAQLAARIRGEAAMITDHTTCIMSKEEFEAAKTLAFNKGVTRGRFEERWDIAHGTHSNPKVILEEVCHHGTRKTLHCALCKQDCALCKQEVLASTPDVFQPENSSK